MLGEDSEKNKETNSIRNKDYNPKRNNILRCPPTPMYKHISIPPQETHTTGRNKRLQYNSHFGNNNISHIPLCSARVDCPCDTLDLFSESKSTDDDAEGIRRTS